MDVYCQELATSYRDVETEQLLRDVRVREAALAALFSGMSTSGQGCGDVADVLRLPKVGPSSWWPPTRGRSSASARRRRPSARWPPSGSARPGARSPTPRSVSSSSTTPSGSPQVMGYLTSLTVGRIGISDTFEAIGDTPAGGHPGPDRPGHGHPGRARRDALRRGAGRRAGRRHP